jgi:hypothetical protein
VCFGPTSQVKKHPPIWPGQIGRPLYSAIAWHFYSPPVGCWAFFVGPLFEAGRSNTTSNYLSGTCCKLHFPAMRLRHSSPAAPEKKLSACVCLVALILLWSPLWVAAWQSASMNCCSGGMCPAHKHKSQQPTPCDHHGDGISQCSMSCCQPESHNVVASNVFVMPLQFTLSRTPRFAPPAAVSSQSEIFIPLAPPDHPPRLLFS